MYRYKTGPQLVLSSDFYKCLESNSITHLTTLDDKMVLFNTTNNQNLYCDVFIRNMDVYSKKFFNQKINFNNFTGMKAFLADPSKQLSILTGAVSYLIGTQITQ